MEIEQEIEWKKAQNIAISIDLVSATKTQLNFLEAVDRKRWLSEGQGLDRAIHRYNTCWLPLLAKHTESSFFEGPLVVPFDCEWIWHCHRLNPVRYKTDCEEFYGKILDNRSVVSSLVGFSRESEEIWKKLYPDEPYDLDFSDALKDNTHGKKLGGEKCTTYDLVSAVERQGPFFYQITRPHMIDPTYLEGSVARYKGFLHLIKERSLDSFSVPTYDIDFIWHAHQLNPISYCSELMAIMGKVLEHDDSVSDRTVGKKLDIGFSDTTHKWEEMYGSRYWRAGAMYRGNPPSPVRNTPYYGNLIEKKDVANGKQKITLPTVKQLEVMLEFSCVRNLPEGHNGSLFVSFCKTQPDAIFNTKQNLTILSESGEKRVASFKCEPTGHLIFELISKPSETMGTTSISLDEIFASGSNLTMEKWLEVVPNSREYKPIGLRVSISVTIPTPTPYVLHMNQSGKSCARVVDEAGDSVISLEIRKSRTLKDEKECTRGEVVGIMKSGETCTLAEFSGSEWSFVNSPWSMQLPDTNNDDGHVLELIGPRNVRLFPGGRLDYESNRCAKHKREGELDNDLMTAVEFSAEYPYGKAVALLDLKSSTVKVKEEWFLFPGITLTFLLGGILKNEGYNSLVVCGKTMKDGESESETKPILAQWEFEVNQEVAKCGCGSMAQCGGCGGVNTVKAGWLWWLPRWWLWLQIADGDRRTNGQPN